MNNFLINSKKLLFFKGQDFELLAHFNIKEFDCKCKNADCYNTTLDYRCLVALDRLRRVINLPIKINSAYRCEKHNAAIGGKTNPLSKHVMGQALDLNNPFPKESFNLFVEFCRECFPVIVPYQSKNFVHCQFN